jgi:hypothetical protein
MRRLAPDHSGQRFGRLLVIERAANDPHGNACWHCSCSCGNELIVRACSLRGGSTRSCGCLARDLREERLAAENLRDAMVPATFVWASDPTGPATASPQKARA